MQTALGAETSQNSTVEPRQRQGACMPNESRSSTGNCCCRKRMPEMQRVEKVLADCVETLMKISVTSSKEYVMGALLEK